METCSHLYLPPKQPRFTVTDPPIFQRPMLLDKPLPSCISLAGVYNSTAPQFQNCGISAERKDSLTPEEIRSVTVEVGEVDPALWACAKWLREIAAQLASLNELTAAFESIATNQDASAVMLGEMVNQIREMRELLASIIRKPTNQYHAYVRTGRESRIIGNE